MFFPHLISKKMYKNIKEIKWKISNVVSMPKIYTFETRKRSNKSTYQSY